jgi:hypothetical protein
LHLIKAVKALSIKGFKSFACLGIISTWVSKSGGAAKVLQQEEEEEELQ